MASSQHLHAACVDAACRFRLATGKGDHPRPPAARPQPPGSRAFIMHQHALQACRHAGNPPRAPPPRTLPARSRHCKGLRPLPPHPPHPSHRPSRPRRAHLHVVPQVQPALVKVRLTQPAKQGLLAAPVRGSLPGVRGRVTGARGGWVRGGWGGGRQAQGPSSLCHTNMTRRVGGKVGWGEEGGHQGRANCQPTPTTTRELLNPHPSDGFQVPDYYTFDG